MADKTIAIEIQVKGLENVRLSAKETDALAASNAKVKQESREVAKAFISQEGSMAKLRAETSLLIQKANQLNTATKEGAKEFNALQKQIVQNKEKIRDFDRQLSGSTTLVGEYERGFSGAFKKIGTAIVAVGGIIAGLRGAWEGFKSVMNSTAETADTFQFAMAELKGTLDGALRTVASGDWKNLRENMVEAGRAAKELAEATDLYNDAQLANKILNAEELDTLFKLESVWRNTSKTYQERTESLDKWVKIKEDAASRELNIETVLNKKLVEELSNRTGLNEVQLKQFATIKGQYPEVIQIATTIQEKQKELDFATDKGLTGVISRRKKTIEELTAQANILLQNTGITVGSITELLSKEINVSQEEINTLSESYTKLAVAQSGNNQIQAETAKARSSLENKAVKEEKKAQDESLMQWRVYYDEKGKIVSEQVRDTSFFGEDQTIKGKGVTSIASKRTSPDPEGDALRKYVLQKTREQARNIKRIEIENAEAIAERKRQINQQLYSSLGTAIGAFSTILEANKQKELSSAGDNAKKREAIEKEYLKKQQNIAVVQAIINAAQGITKIWAQWGFPLAIPFSAVEAAATIAQITLIKSQKFAKGGLLYGPSHERGGIPIRVNGQSGYEAEGGEAIINKRSTAKYKALLSRINEDGGGKKFAAGGMLPEQSNFTSIDLNKMSMIIAKNISSIKVINSVGEFRKADAIYAESNTRSSL